MFVTLILFWMMISCYKICQDASKNSQHSMLSFMKKRLTDPRYSSTWKLVFFGMRYVQAIVLLLLFYSGMEKINNFQNLGFMLFFLLFTAYEDLYRRFGFLLSIFISIFIVGQYTFSFVFPYFMDDQKKMERFQWWGLIPIDDKITDPFEFNQKANSFYAKLEPSKFNWCVLVMMSMLNGINKMFSEKEEIIKLTIQCENNLNDQYTKLFYYLARVKTISKGLIIYALIIFMIFIHSKLETNIINWIFFTLQMINFALIVKGTSSLSDIKQKMFVVSLIKIFAFIILFMDIQFITFIGELAG